MIYWPHLHVAGFEALHRKFAAVSRMLPLSFHYVIQPIIQHSVKIMMNLLCVCIGNDSMC